MGVAESIIETGFYEEKARIMQVRYAVFVAEQGVPEELEQDEKDPVCRHALLLMEKTIQRTVGGK